MLKVAGGRPVPVLEPRLALHVQGSWLAVYAAAAALLFLPAWIHGDSAWIGNDGDAKLIVWYLTEVSSAIAHGHNPLMTTLIQNPDGISLMWNASVLLPAVVVAPLTALAGPVAAYNLLVITGVVSSAWFARAAIQRFVDMPIAAGVGGLVYGLSPFVVAQSMGHLHMAFAAFPPIALLLISDLLRRDVSARRTGILLGLTSAAQLLIGEELLLITAIGAATALGIAALQHRCQARQAWPRIAAVVAIGAAIVITIDAPFLVLQFLGPHRPSAAAVPSGGLVADLEGLVIPTPRQEVSPAWATRYSTLFTVTAEDVDAYVGLPLLVYLAWRFGALRSDPRTRFALGVAGCVFLLSLGPALQVGHATIGVPLPWEVLGRLPVLEHVAPARYAVIVDLMVALVVAVEIEDAMRRRRASRASGLATAARPRMPLRLAALAACVVSLLPAVPFPATPDVTPAFFTRAASRIPDGSVVLVTPWADSNGSEAMLWQARAGLRWSMPSGEALGNGSGLDGPASTLRLTLDTLVRHGGALTQLTPALGAALLDDLRRLGIQVIVVGPSPGALAVRALFAHLLGGVPEEIEGVTVWWTVTPAGTS